MWRGVGLIVAGSLVLLGVVGCTGGWFQQREPWRREAEVACLRSGAVRLGGGIAQMGPIQGPGVCGADFPLKVTFLGEGAVLGFAAEPRPPQPIPVVAPYDPRVQGATPRGRALGEPVPLHPNGPPEQEETDLSAPTLPSGPSHGPATVAGAAVVPPATLACPMVSALDRWISEGLQPAAYRWFGQPVIEIKQISAYSCRGMNGNPHARISEHAFGNALDIAAFTLADGRRITVREGWRGLPEERGFLRDVHAAACREFTTVLGPGSNVFHYDHFHFDLMRRASHICNPPPLPGDLVAGRRGRTITGSLAPSGETRALGFAEEVQPAFPYVPEQKLPRAVPGED
jgi:hypothetical protein